MKPKLSLTLVKVIGCTLPIKRSSIKISSKLQKISKTKKIVSIQFNGDPEVIFDFNQESRKVIPTAALIN
jgi:hypothetical protein